jgi:hypothetical protein
VVLSPYDDIIADSKEFSRQVSTAEGQQFATRMGMGFIGMPSSSGNLCEVLLISDRMFGHEQYGRE